MGAVRGPVPALDSLELGLQLTAPKVEHGLAAKKGLERIDPWEPKVDPERAEF